MAPLTHEYAADSFFDTTPDWLTPEQTSYGGLLYPDAHIENHPEPKLPATGQVKQQPRSKAMKKNKGESVSNNNGLRFFVVAHPDQLKDRKQMRQNRQHVMHDYLDKEAKKPDSKDSRVRKHSSRLTNIGNESTPGDALSDGVCRQEISLLTPAESNRGRDGSHDTSDGESDGRRSKKVTRVSSLKRVTSDSANGRPGPVLQNERPLIQGLGGRFDNSRYMKATVDDIPFSVASNKLGRDLNPFGTWPSFDDASMNVNELKFSCSQRFGTYGLSVHWIPTLLRARHAFLSTLCISSSHDDIMRRNLLTPKQRAKDHRLAASLMKRLRVRQEVISMINESINDPDLRVADETIVAVLHVLNSEIMGCDDRSMRIHQVGLHEMVRERGGLEKLGINGQLASILTITMFLLGSLRETHPHRDFMRYASSQLTRVPHDVSDLPESPIYCRPDSFQNINRALSRNHATYVLLETVRKLTNEFFLENAQGSASIPSPPETAESSDQANSTISVLRDAIFAHKPAWEKDFDEMNDRYTYESLRLTAIVYAHAISRRIPFSKAAAELGDPRTRPAAVELPAAAAPVPIMLKNALMRTDTSSCWDHLAGVLFWATLIAGATANPGPFANEERESEDEDARKWITAIAVRCCIVLSFEYGAAVLETLKRVVAVQTVLARAGQDDVNETSGGFETTWTEVDLDGRSSEQCSKQRGFSDFAQEFMNI